MLSRVTKTENQSLIKIYEDKITSAQRKKVKLQNSKTISKRTKEEFRTALDEVMGCVKSPYNTWLNGGFNDKRLVLLLVFVEPIVYSVENGFRTTNPSHILRLFEDFVFTNSQDVEDFAPS